MRVLATMAVLMACSAGIGCAVAEEEVGFHRLFHLVGIPGVARDARVNLVLGADALVFHNKKVRYEVPYARIRRVLLLSGNRVYERTTYLAAVATYGVGGLLILKKHRVDTVVLDYGNERGGKMGIVVQMETGQGELLKDLLTGKGISIDAPEASPKATTMPKPETNTTERSKQ